MSVLNGQLANAATFNGAFVSKTANSTISATLTQDKESVMKEIATPSTPSSGYGKIYFKSDGKLYSLNDAGIEVLVGANTGGGGVAKNFITNGNAEDNNTTGWAVYADAAGTSPVDGTGGTANVTNTASGTSPLVGAYSFLLAKDAVNRQGQGWSYAFSIDSAFQAKVLQISFEYLVSSGTFVAGTDSADSDVTVWIYDVTNAVLIQPSSYKLLSKSSSLSDRFTANFQSASNSTSYRLIFHVGSTSASAYTLKVDDISVSPSVYAYGTPITDWESYTPTFTAFGTVSNVEYQYRRVGGDLEIRGKFTMGTTTGSEARVSLPAGLTSADTATIPSIQLVGYGVKNNNTTTQYAILQEPSTTYHVFGTQSAGTSGLTKSIGTDVGSSTQLISYFARIPIQGWASSVKVSSETDTRVVAALVQGSTTSIATTDTLVVMPTVVKDSHGAYSTSTGLYTVPVSGWYEVRAYLTISSVSLTTSQTFASLLYKNGSLDRPISTIFGNGGTNAYRTFGTATTFCNAGDTLAVYAFNGNTTTALTSATASNNWLSFERVSGPSVIAASDSVNARYTTTAAQSIPSGSATTVVFGTKEYDSHSIMNATTGVVTIPTSGKWSIKAGIRYQAYNASDNILLTVVKNGSTSLSTGAVIGISGTVNNWATSVSSTETFNAGDTVEIKATQSSGVSRSLTTTASENFFCIDRVGN